MQLRNFISAKTLPIWFLGTLILLTFSDFLTNLSSAVSLPGLLGTIPVLAITAFGMFAKETRINSTAPLLLFCGIIACWMSTLWFPEVATDSIHLAATGLALVCSFCVILLSFKEVSYPKNHEDFRATEVLKESFEQFSDDNVPLMNSYLNTGMNENNIVLSDSEDHCESDGKVVQSWTRVRLGNESERLEGTIHLQFRAGEQIQHCHIPLSPAFAAIPEAFSECHDSSFQAEFTTLQTYGVRLTVRRPIHDLRECSTDVSVMLLHTAESRSVA